MNAVAHQPGPVRVRLSLVLVLSSLLLGTVSFISLFFGAGDTSYSEVLQVLMGQGSEQAQFVVTDLRLSRLWLGLVVGAALGAAGALLQCATRNPLAEPGLLGVSAGASFAVVLSIMLGASAAGVHLSTAILGALCGCGLVLLTTLVGGLATDPVRLILAGAAFSSLIFAMTTLILLFDQRSADEIRFWVIGALGGRSLDTLVGIVPVVIASLVAIALLLRPLAALALGEQVATGLGHHPQMTRALTLLIVALLVGSATAAAGPIGFVGLVVPFLARAMVGADIRRVIWVSVLLGPVVVLAADIVSRLVVRPYELPIGVITALIGAPILVAVVRSQRMPSL